MGEIFEQSGLWKRTLAVQENDGIYEKQRELLRNEFLKFRDKARILAGEIVSVLPEFTVHDITHIDALWEAATLVVGSEFKINPVEAFVLGGAFLIHDLGMAITSFRNGIEDIKKEVMWRDMVVSLSKKKGLDYNIGVDNLIRGDSEIEKMATETVLRVLHAKHAEDLSKISWKDDSGNEIFLIENAKLREAYGSVIGGIAYSHGWNVSELEKKLLDGCYGAIGEMPIEWTVDPIKLACILRIADAIQIDDRRAPIFLKILRNPRGYSNTHWTFQQKLYKPTLEKNRLRYTSKSPFSIDEVDSWWVCYDTLKMIDNQLKEVDALLTDTNRETLEVIGVSGIESIERISKLISVSEWKPIDTRIKITNVADLVTKLGGEQLYGRNLIVPLRELMQNASDAIRARRIYEGEEDSFGDITIRIGSNEEGEYIEVEDNGIGMSSNVLTGPFLDFGQSFWGSNLMYEELPGLESKGFNSTGKYGIGFFSVFMWGKRVQVYTRRAEEARDNTLLLEFDEKTYTRPILRKVTKREEVIKNGGTKIRVMLDKEVKIKDILCKQRYGRNKMTLEEVIEEICPNIDCNIIKEEDGKRKKIIRANDWKELDNLEFLKRVIGRHNYHNLKKQEKELIEKLSSNLSFIKEADGKIVGRALIYKDEERTYPGGSVTVGGFRTSGLTGIIGILEGVSHTAARDIGIPIVSQDKLAEWATDQAQALTELNLDDKSQVECAAVVRACNGSTRNLKVAYHKNGLVSCSMVKEIIEKTQENEFIVVQDVKILRYQKENKSKINFNNNVFWVECGIPGVLQTRNDNYYIQWPPIPKEKHDWFDGLSLRGVVMEAISQAWRIEIKNLLDNSQLSSDEESYCAVVGKVNETKLEFDHVNIIKKYRM